MQRPFWKDLALLSLKPLVAVVTVFLVIVVGFGTITALWEAGDYVVSDGICNIAVVPVEGVILPFSGLGLGDFDLVTTPAQVRDMIASIELDKQIEGILLEVNSPGGTPVASQQIAEIFRYTELPVVGLIGDIGTSGGYMVAAAADFLLASPMSDVGSIGVNMSYIEESERNKEEGLTYVQLVTGKYKDIGSPNRPITTEERELLQMDLEIVHNEFVDIVAEYRELDRRQVAEIADGASMPGRRAVEANLIDALGGRAEARAVLARYLDLDPVEVVFCEYQPKFF